MTLGVAEAQTQTEAQIGSTGRAEQKGCSGRPVVLSTHALTKQFGRSQADAVEREARLPQLES